MTGLIESKNRLCRLLAQENFDIVHKKGIKTASINLETRTVYLPMWKDLEGNEMPAEVYDVLVSHEGYGHGVNTPPEGWHSALGNHSRAFKSFLNIIEDARIEKLVKRKYPGIRKSYVVGYKWFVDNGLFGKDIALRVNDGTLKFIDRLNLHAKIGSQLGAEFTAEEMVYVERMYNLETWDEVVELAVDLFNKAKEDKEKDTDEDDIGGGGMGNPEDLDDYDFEDSDDFDDNETGDDTGDSQDEDDDETDETSSGEQSDDEGEDDSDDEDETDNETGGGASDDSKDDDEDENDDDLIAETDENFEENLKKLVDDKNDVDDVVYTFPKMNDADTITIGYKRIIEEMTEHYTLNNTDMTHANQLVKDWKRDNIKVVNYLAKEFEMKKAADEYSRSSTGKTGVLDPVKLHSYKFNDDVFKRVTTVADGKNHGLVMYLDWSGSMNEFLEGTMDQLHNLVSFCRKVNIPFEVYAFTDQYDRENCGLKSNMIKEDKIGQLVPDSRLHLLQLFSSKMNGSDFNKMMVLTKAMAVGNGYGYSYGYRPAKGYVLGGTPLDSTILVAIDQVQKFKEKNRLQVVNTVFLTDGQSHSCYYQNENSSCGNIERSHAGGYFSKKTVSIRDDKTKKEYKLDGNVTKTLLTALREIAQVEVAGFFVTKPTVNEARYWMKDFFNDYHFNSSGKDLLKQFRKDKFLISTTAGYSELYLIAGDSLESGNTSMEEVSSDATKAQLKRAFLKAGNSKLKNRVILQKFIDMVA